MPQPGFHANNYSNILGSPITPRTVIISTKVKSRTWSRTCKDSQKPTSSPRVLRHYWLVSQPIRMTCSYSMLHSKKLIRTMTVWLLHRNSSNTKTSFQPSELMTNGKKLSKVVNSRAKGKWTTLNSLHLLLTTKKSWLGKTSRQLSRSSTRKTKEWSTYLVSLCQVSRKVDLFLKLLLQKLVVDNQSLNLLLTDYQVELTPQQ